MMFRESKEDTVLPSADRLDSKLYVKQGTYFVLDVIGICKSPVLHDSIQV